MKKKRKKTRKKRGRLTVARARTHKVLIPFTIPDNVIGRAFTNGPFDALETHRSGIDAGHSKCICASANAASNDNDK